MSNIFLRLIFHRYFIMKIENTSNRKNDMTFLVPPLPVQPIENDYEKNALLFDISHFIKSERLGRLDKEDFFNRIKAFQLDNHFKTEIKKFLKNQSSSLLSNENLNHCLSILTAFENNQEDRFINNFLRDYLLKIKKLENDQNDMVDKIDAEYGKAIQSLEQDYQKRLDGLKTELHLNDYNLLELATTYINKENAKNIGKLQAKKKQFDHQIENLKKNDRNLHSDFSELHNKQKDANLKLSYRKINIQRLKNKRRLHVLSNQGIPYSHYRSDECFFWPITQQWKQYQEALKPHQILLERGYQMSLKIGEREFEGKINQIFADIEKNYIEIFEEFENFKHNFIS